MSSTRRSSFGSDSFALVVGQAMITVFALASAVITARALDADGRGQFSLALLLASTLFTFTEFGLGSAGTRLIASGRWSGAEILASHAFAVAVRVVIAGLIGLALVAWASDDIFPGVPVEYLLLGLLQLAPLSVAGSILPLLLGLGQARTYNRILVLSSSIALGSLATGWAVMGLDVRRALLLQLGAAYVTAWVIWNATRKGTGGLARPSFRYLGEAYRFGLGIYASGLISFINTRLIWLLINGLAGVTAVGLYSIAQVATERVYLVADALGTILFPRIAQDPEKNSSRITPAVFRITLIIGAGLATVLAILAGWLVRFLFSDSFAASTPIVRLLLVAVVFSSGWRILSQDLNGRGRSGVTAVVNGIATVVGLGLAWLLLPRIGLEGAAFSAIATGGMSLSAGIWLFGHYGNSGKGLADLFVPTLRERKFASRLVRGAGYAAQAGPGFAWALSKAYLLDVWALQFAYLVAPLRRRLDEVVEWLSVPIQTRRARRLQANIRGRALISPALQLEEFGLSSASVTRVRDAACGGGEVILGEFDHYGRLVSAFGPIAGMPCIPAEEADPRRRAKVLLVLTPQGIGVRKWFHGANARQRFLRELRALELLRGTAARVPEVVQIDVASLSLLTTFVGLDLEQLLTARGAQLTGAQIRERLGAAPTASEIFNEYLKEGAKHVAALPSSFVDSVYEQLQVLHRHGIRMHDIKYGNVAIHYKSGLPYFIDFDAATVTKQLRSRAFLIERDRDTEKFNAAFGTDRMTYRRLRDRIRRGDFPGAEQLYASTYIGHGLRIGPLWDRTTGFGRWHFILKRKLQLLPGAKVLSLGANNGSIELMLLRAGAEEVVAFERDDTYAAQGRFLAAACQWADNSEYRLTYVLLDMQEAVRVEDKFDCVLALCSLYYLPEVEMRTVARAVAKLSRRFVLQCNTQDGIGREEDDQYRRASLEFAVELLEDAGFSSVVVTAPKGYSRPVAEGRHVGF